ncbi:hypothetical protein ISCGN_012227 [Ixodes scapularis]
MRLPDGDDVDVRTLMRRRFRAPAPARMLFLLLVVHVRCGAGIEPVRLQPLHFMPTVKSGDNVQTMCAVQSGGEQVTFSWTKDSQPLATGHRVAVHSLPTTSILLVKNASVFDAGNYTCTGRNPLGQDSVTATLSVQGRPHWLKEPVKELVVALGEETTLRCDVIGSPQARVTWSRLNKEDLVEEPPGPRWQTGRDSSSLEMVSVSRDDVGTYRCRADNGLGQISADMDLVVRGRHFLFDLLHAEDPVTSLRGPSALPKLHFESRDTFRLAGSAECVGPVT